MLTPRRSGARRPRIGHEATVVTRPRRDHDEHSDSGPSALLGVRVAFSDRNVRRASSCRRARACHATDPIFPSCVLMPSWSTHFLTEQPVARRICAILPCSLPTRPVIFRTATICLTLVAIVRVVDPLREGLTITLFSDRNWSSPVVRSLVDTRFSTEGLFAAWRGRPPGIFSVTWNGSVIVLHDDAYTFATTSDDGSWVYVDGALVVDNGGDHSSRVATGVVHLKRGVHKLFVRYFQGGDQFDFNLRWGTRSSSLAPLAAWAVSPRSPPFSAFLASVVARRILQWGFFAWLALAGLIGISFAAESIVGYLAAPVRPPMGGVFLGIGMLMLLFVLPHQITSDGSWRYLELAELIEWHDISPLAYSLIGPLFSAPLYLLGKVVMSPDWWCARFNSFVFVSGLIVIYRLWRTQIDHGVLISFLLLLVTASMFPFHVEGYFGEVFTTVLVGVGLSAVACGKSFGGWTAAIIGVANTPATLVGLTLAAVLHTVRTRRMRHIAPPFVAAAVIMMESWVRRGSLFTSGYEGNAGIHTILTYAGRPGFSYPLFFGVLSVLFSFGKGIVFFAPGVVLPMKKQLGHSQKALWSCYLLWMSFLAGLIIVYSKWWAWFGGEYWGPRFFLCASLPACLAIAVWLKRDQSENLSRPLSLLLILTWSVWVAIDGVAFSLSGLEACRDPNYEHLCLYVPEFSPLWRPFVEFTKPSLDALVVALYFCLVYAYLALPIVRAIGKQLNVLASSVSTQADFRDWHF